MEKGGRGDERMMAGSEMDEAMAFLVCVCEIFRGSAVCRAFRFCSIKPAICLLCLV